MNQISRNEIMDLSIDLVLIPEHMDYLLKFIQYYYIATSDMLSFNSFINLDANLIHIDKNNLDLVLRLVGICQNIELSILYKNNIIMEDAIAMDLWFILRNLVRIMISDLTKPDFELNGNESPLYSTFKIKDDLPF